MPLATPPNSFFLVTSFPKSALVQLFLNSFINKLPHPSISSPSCTNGIHEPTLSKITSIFGNPIPSVVDSLQISFPTLNPPSPYEPFLISALPQALQRQIKE
ncbi:hypothetical protein O181_004403 [Austropuccinia psidii MF-1]|uniref:Uncharacterized protein n=1 Tax=Austropuccinia psidii MF-1 TaxID=1389203 RepID=A0A9Q3BGA0_9BASI|nr:hypothetical protein [Austropuccinia psidii MF-1]